MKLVGVYTMLVAQDMARAVAFYRDVIGLTVKFEDPHWSELQFGDATVAFHGGGDGTRRDTDLGFDVTDIERACAEIAVGGGTVVEPPRPSNDAPILVAKVLDSEGNQVTLSQSTYQD